MFDLLIKNATVIDGTGKPAFSASIATENGKIKVLSANCGDKAKTVIDGTGLDVSPGFIDAHSHGDVPLGKQFASLSKISQGITTHVAGQCGFSMFPVNPSTLNLMKAGMAIFTDTFPVEMETFTTFENWLKYASTVKIPENIVFLMGHVSLRIAAMGFENRKPTHDEMEVMKSMMREAMEHGALGLSTGLIYIPSVYAEIDEIAELCKIVAEYDGVYATHMRNESYDVIKSIKEALEVARRSGCRLQISHLKVCGKPNWGLSTEIVKLLENARAEGIRVTADQYSYTASMTHLNSSIPPKYFTKGIPGMVNYLKDPVMREQIKREIMDPNTPFENQYLNCDGFDNIFISSCAATPEYEGQKIGDSARKAGKEPFEVFFDILIRNNGVVSAIYFAMCEDDVFRILKDDSVMVGTDGIVKAGHERSHPRAYGGFPRAISYFVREKHVLPLEDMIRKMTGLTAEKLMLPGKGIIADGYDADLVVFDYDTVRDTADFINSDKLADGIEYVVVGGEIVYHDKKLTGACPGKIVLHNRKA